jgi:uncharacterized cupin superfamily protein
VAFATNDVSETGFTVWGLDKTPYGPVELPTLVAWIKDERVTADTWIYVGRAGVWQKAAEIPELQLFFRPRIHAAGNGSSSDAVKPAALRRVKILGSMDDDQLTQLAQRLEVEKVPQWSVVVHEGDPGDSMFLILEGEFRVRTNIGGRETILATLGTGEFFGDVCVFDKGTRSADVVANTAGVLLKVSAAALEAIAAQAPELASRLVMAMCKTLSARFRHANKRLTDFLRLSQAAG